MGAGVDTGVWRPRSSLCAVGCFWLFLVVSVVFVVLGASLGAVDYRGLAWVSWVGLAWVTW